MKGHCTSFQATNVPDEPFALMHVVGYVTVLFSDDKPKHYPTTHEAINTKSTTSGGIIMLNPTTFQSDY